MWLASPAHRRPSAAGLPGQGQLAGFARSQAHQGSAQRPVATRDHAIAERPDQTVSLRRPVRTIAWALAGVRVNFGRTRRAVSTNNCTAVYDSTSGSIAADGSAIL